ncbi:STAS domain-containing protein [Robertmurraya sp. FSL R5-0851]|uniref:STAS domain-containing protein n=1 Tax=Robertmurraya sp. FSL R5-0851 TaxID=2921584 RepID=UPI00092965FB|nr:Putative anti-sigma factor antagonist TM_1442 [Mycobacteroides abscessus subsp. abscessus]
MVREEIITYNWNQDVTLNTADLFREELQTFIQTDNNKLILSLKGVGYINSAGLGVIADAVMQARKQGKELVVANIQGPISEIFEIVKFGSFIHLFATEEEATHFLRNK